MERNIAHRIDPFNWNRPNGLAERVSSRDVMRKYLVPYSYEYKDTEPPNIPENIISCYTNVTHAFTEDTLTGTVLVLLQMLVTVPHKYPPVHY